MDYSKVDLNMGKDELFLRFRDERDIPSRRDTLRSRIEDQTQAFLAAGGEIKEVKKGDGKNSPVPITRQRLWELNG